jgi:hypothetical protein
MSAYDEKVSNIVHPIEAQVRRMQRSQAGIAGPGLARAALDLCDAQHDISMTSNRDTAVH